MWLVDYKRDFGTVKTVSFRTKGEAEMFVSNKREKGFDAHIYEVGDTKILNIDLYTIRAITRPDESHVGYYVVSHPGYGQISYSSLGDAAKIVAEQVGYREESADAFADAVIKIWNSNQKLLDI
jgi:hypothetical protein